MNASFVLQYNRQWLMLLFIYQRNVEMLYPQQLYADENHWRHDAGFAQKQDKVADRIDGCYSQGVVG